MMLTKSVKILLIEDNLAEARLLQEFLKQAKSNEFILVHVKRLKEALERLNSCSTKNKLCTFDVILLDLTLPDSQGLESLPFLIKIAPGIPIVVLTNTNDDQLAIEAVRQGAQDYLVKRQIVPEALLRSLRYAIERKQALETLRADNEALETSFQQQKDELVKIKEINQFKSEFVSMLSHDIRNPLNVILLAAGLLKNSDGQLTNDKKTANYQLIRSAVKNMTSLLDEASLIGKVDANKLQCQLSQLNLQELCHQLVEEAQVNANSKNINIINNIYGNPIEALWDENLLRHILSNLLNNAIKYSHINTQVFFEIIYQDITVIFRVKDIGIGIPESDQSHLFQPFHRASNVDNISGTGLGLAIVKKCVEVCDGEITFTSKVGVGTEFIVTLPVIKVRS